MKRKKINWEKYKNTSIEKILAKLGYFPSKKSEKEAWYLSPFRSETEASFKLSLLKNRWYDHGLGKGGNAIDLIVELKKCPVKYAIKFLEEDLVGFSFQKPKNFEVLNDEKNYEILEVKKLQHNALIDYLKSRCIDIKIAQQFCSEIHYKMNDKKYFAIAFQNRSDGFSIRNKFFKGNLLKKDISIIKNNSKSVCIYEGFFDFLSYLTLNKNRGLEEDYIILNSTSMIDGSLETLKKYTLIKTYFDNDNSGNKAIETLKNNFQNKVKDHRIYYKKHNDLNDYLIKRERRTLLKS